MKKQNSGFEIQKRLVFRWEISAVVGGLLLFIAAVLTDLMIMNLAGILVFLYCVQRAHDISQRRWWELEEDEQ